MVETVIEAIRINVVTEQHVVILKEADGQRVVPIWIGQFEAQAIALELQGADISRPLTHDLLRSVIDQMGGVVERIVVSDLRDSTFFATIGIGVNGRELAIDSRPSDAIALAVRTQAKIYVEEHVLNQAGIAVPGDKPEHVDEDAPAAPLDPAERERLNVFRDFVNSLEIDDPKSEND